MKLVPRLVPQPIWGVCLRNAISKSKWNKISKAVRKAANYKCEICGGDGTDAVPKYSSWELCCDEVWAYVLSEDGPPRAVLTDLMNICYWCNATIHIGYIRATGSKELKEKAMAHALQVNNISEEEMKPIISEAFDLWRNLSEHEGWQVSWEDWKDILKKKGIEIK